VPHDRSTVAPSDVGALTVAMVTVKPARREADSASVAVAIEQEHDRKPKADDAERRHLAKRAARADLVAA
jgi:hypothetical protein